MRGFTFGVLVAALFGLGFAGTLTYQAKDSGRPIASLFVPSVVCDIADETCRNRLASQAELFVGAGDIKSAIDLHRRLGAAGDFRSAFQLGWIYEEIYRAAVGRKLAGGSPVVEEGRFAVLALPEGVAFDELIERHSHPATEQDRLVDARSLAFLWYGRAAKAGFAPAMNNLASMYQFGLLGPADLTSARRWYLAAYDAGSPVAAYNLERLRMKGYGISAIDCVELAGSGWLPLVNKPSEGDLSVAVFPRTRFRGRGLDRAMVELIGMDVLGVTDPAAWSRAANVPPEQVTWLRGAIDAAKYGVADWEFDDEVPSKPSDLPSFEEVREQALKAERQRGSCKPYSADPRTAAVEAAEARRDALRKQSAGMTTGVGSRSSAPLN